MDQESITKGLISGIVDHYIREIAQDPHRSIRKLLDMAERTSDGPTQKICYQMMQKMAENQSSPYYEMIHRLVTGTDPETIKQFGINLGRNAWTFGSGNIRRLIAQNGVSIPWVVIIDRQKTAERIPFPEIEKLIDRGRKMDVYAWMFISPSSLDEWEEYAAVIRSHADCVFGLCTLPNALTEDILEEAADLPNLMFLLNTDEPDWQLCAGRLSAKRLLYSACRFVRNRSQAEEILNGSWLEELQSCHPLMAFSIAADSLPVETARAVKEYMWRTRLDQVYPVLPSDLISDFVIINHLVTHRDILYRVNSDGSVSEANELQFQPVTLHHTDLFGTAGTVPGVPKKSRN